MREMKAGYIDDLYCEFYESGMPMAYLKDDADEVIAHTKYKRCLAMARWCTVERDIYNLTPRFAKVEFYRKWKKRWLELAEKFKEAKFLQLIHKECK